MKHHCALANSQLGGRGGASRALRPSASGSRVAGLACFPRKSGYFWTSAAGVVSERVLKGSGRGLEARTLDTNYMVILEWVWDVVLA